MKKCVAGFAFNRPFQFLDRIFEPSVPSVDIGEANAGLNGILPKLKRFFVLAERLRHLIGIIESPGEVDPRAHVIWVALLHRFSEVADGTFDVSVIEALASKRIAFVGVRANFVSGG